MSFSVQSFKGLDKCLVADSIDPKKLGLHITELEAGARPHPPHAHTGIEAFYVLEGSGALETEGQQFPIGVNEAIMLDSTRAHSIINTGTTKMRYLVIITE